MLVEEAAVLEPEPEPEPDSLEEPEPELEPVEEASEPLVVVAMVVMVVMPVVSVPVAYNIVSEMKRQSRDIFGDSQWRCRCHWS